MGLTTLKRRSYLLDGSIYDIVICIQLYPGERGQKEEQEGEYIVQRGVRNPETTFSSRW